jgi:hypothetical protein
MLKNILEASGLRDTVSTDIYVQARKVEIEKTQQLLQDFQKAHAEAITKVYEQLKSSCLGNHVCREMHERDSWA